MTEEIREEQKFCEDPDAPRERYELEVPPELAGQRIDAALVRMIGDISRTRTQQFVKEGYTRVNGILCRLPRFYLAAGDRIVIDAPGTPVCVRAEAENIPLDILYEDEHILVINKQAGMVVHPGVGNHSGTVVNAVLGHDSDMADEDFPNPLRPGVVHRLDKDTSGCLVIARTPRALRKLSKSFADRDVEKTYLAIVFGTPVPPAAVIRGFMGRHPTDRLKMAVLRETDHGAKEAVTAYRTLRQGIWNEIRCSLVQVRLHTGRTHQIRVHMSHIGHPLIGDKLYARGRSSPAERQMLHAWKLVFPHPETGEALSFEAPIPADFQAVTESFQSDGPGMVPGRGRR